MPFLLEHSRVMYPPVSEALNGSNVPAAMDSGLSRKSGLQPCVSGIPSHCSPTKPTNRIDFSPCKTELTRFRSCDFYLPSPSSNLHLASEFPWWLSAFLCHLPTTFQLESQFLTHVLPLCQNSRFLQGEPFPCRLVWLGTQNGVCVWSMADFLICKLHHNF